MNDKSSGNGRSRIASLLALSWVFLSLTAPLAGASIGTAFTYQGRLTSGSTAASGVYDFSFGIYDAVAGGSQIGSTWMASHVSVTDGTFTVSLDFGDVFTGSARWLEIAVRTNGVSDFTVLAPRQPLTPSPYALYAQNTDPASISRISRVQTNLTVYGSPMAAGGMDVTNWFFDRQYTGNTNWFVTNSFWLRLWGIGTKNATQTDWARGGIEFDAVTGAYFNMFFNPYHDPPYNAAGHSEMQITTSGGLALTCNFNNIVPSTYNGIRRAWQWGIGGWGQPFIYHQADLIPSAINTNLMGSMFPEFWKINVWTNGLVNPNPIQAGSLDASFTQEPCLWARAISTNGAASVAFYDNLSIGVNAKGNWENQETARKRLEMIMHPTEGAVKFTGDLYANGLKGLTTNKIVGNEVWVFQNGILVSIEPYWDDAFEAYLARTSIPKASTYATNVNWFIKALRANGVYANCLGLYPFCGDNASTNGQNLISASHTIEWFGTFDHQDVTGIYSAPGHNGYGRTGWTVTGTNGWMFLYLKQGATEGYSYYAGANRTSPVYYYAAVQANSPVGNGMRYAWNTSIGVSALPAFPSSVVIQMKDNATFEWFNGGSNVPVATGQVTPYAPIALDVYLLARNQNDGTPGSYCDAYVQGFAFGTNALSGAQYQVLHDAFVALNTTLGR